MSNNKKPLEILPADKPKLSRMFMIFMDGDPMLVTESFDEGDDVLEQFRAGIVLPPDRDFTIEEVYACDKEELERVKLILELRAGLFNMQQIAMALRMGKSGLVAPTGHPM